MATRRRVEFGSGDADVKAQGWEARRSGSSAVASRARRTYGSCANTRDSAWWLQLKRFERVGGGGLENRRGTMSK